MQCRKSWPRWRRGSITVFLCLLLTSVLGVVGVCLEYGRAQAVSCQLQLAADSAAESVFAGFHAPLFSEYQLLGRLIPAGNFDLLNQETLRYVHSYAGQRGEGNDKGNYVNFREDDAQWSEITFLTDQNGNVFTHMAAEALLSSGVNILIDEWNQHLGLNQSNLSSLYRENQSKSGLADSDFSKNLEGWSENLAEAEEQAIARASAADQEATRRAEEEERERAAAENREAEEVAPCHDAMDQLNARRAEGRHFLDMIQEFKEIINGGVLELVIPKDREVSAGAIPRGNLPSELSAAEKSRCLPGGSVSPGNALLVREYLLRSMKSFTSNSDQSVAYELEYVIAGKTTDPENLKAVVEKLVLIRTAVNLAYLATSARKQTEVREAAALAVGWTGMLPLVEVTATLFLAAWGLAESICDVRALLAGRRIELLKNDANWKLSFGNIVTDLADQEAGSDADDTGSGMTYEDYLRILLYLTEGRGIVYRGMDVIQWNMAGMDPDFLMCNCMVSGRMTAKASTSPIFAVLYGQMGGLGSMHFEKKSSYSYIK